MPPVKPLSEYEDHPAIPSSEQPDHLRGNCDPWGTGTGTGTGEFQVLGEDPVEVVESPERVWTVSLPPVPYKAETIDGNYVLTGADNYYIIEFREDQSGDFRYMMLEDREDFVEGQETTLVTSIEGGFVLRTAEGVTLNNIEGPADFTVGALADGVMLKRIGPSSWLGLGDCLAE